MAPDVMCLCVFLLFSGLQFTTGCKVSSGIVSCSPGESVLLPCSDITSHHTEVEWWFSARQSHSIKQVYPVDGVKGQRDRVQIHTNLSLSITRLTVDDEGTYLCNTTKLNKAHYVSLYVEGCSISGSEGSEEISRYSGESVFLSCLIKCSSHKPDSEFRWILPDYREINQAINPTELHRLYQGRFHMFDIRSGNLSLMISDLTEEDEGLYSCWSNNQHKNFTLNIKGSAVVLDYQYYIYYIFLVFLLCLMLVLVAGCIFWRFTRAKKQRRGSKLLQIPDDEDDTYTSVVYSSS